MRASPHTRARESRPGTGLAPHHRMPNKIRINLANEQELRELPGIGAPEAATIVRFRSEHGPIADVAALARVLGNRTLADGLGARADFAPADSTAPEAPGA
jgi:DNA uptake protein ComE-like DNA-binding protein